MRLFSTSAETDNKDDGNRIILDRSKVVLISRNQKVQTDIKNILKMHNVNNVVQKKVSLNEYLDDASTKDAGWMILDIEDEKDINAINDVTSLIVPYDVYYVLVGNTDSIAFAKSLYTSSSIESSLTYIPNSSNCSFSLLFTSNFLILTSCSLSTKAICIKILLNKAYSPSIISIQCA